MTQTSTPRVNYRHPRRHGIQVGQVITGWDVTMGGHVTGTVAEIIQPVRGSGDSSPRYRLTDTGRFYGNGRPIEPIVFA